MKKEIVIFKEFGARLSDGAAALSYRTREIDPYITLCDEIVFDFSDVRIANSSFINALITDLVEQNGDDFLDRAVFRGCNSTIQVLIESAIHLGQKKAESCAA